MLVGEIGLDERVALLRRVGLFEQVPIQELRLLAALLSETVCRQDQTIFREGDDGDSFHIVTAGKVAIVKGEAGRQEILAVLGPDEFFGEVALLDGSPRSAGAVARTDVRLLSLSRDALHDAIQRSPDILWRITPALTGRLREVSDRLMVTLRTLEDRNRELQQSYRTLEEANAALASRLKRRWVRPVAVAAAVAVGMGVGYWQWTGGALSAPGPATTRPAAAPVGLPAGDVFTLAPRPVQTRVKLSGKLEPRRIVNLPSPLASTVAEAHFTYGSVVAKGDLLLRLETTKLDAEIRDARAKLITAEQTLADHRKWAEGSEVANARRTVTRAESQAASAARNQQDAADLFGKGIIPERDVAMARQQLESARMDLASARDALAAVLRKGSEERVAIAEMEAENARVRLTELIRRKELSDIRAPAAGVVMRPTVKTAANLPQEIEVGHPVTDGQLLLAVGETAALAVRTSVDEFDVTKIRIGQQALVTTEALDQSFAGQVTALSSQPAASDEKAAGVARYAVEVTISNIDETALRHLRLGMSASVEVTLRDNPQALLVPPRAVRQEADGGYHVLRLNAAGEPQSAPVRLGGRYPEGLEVVEGLAPGDRLMVRK